MEANLYHKIKKLILSGAELKVSYSPNGIECDMELEVKNVESNIINELDQELINWWHEDLSENYLLPLEIYGGGDFEFKIIDNELWLDSMIKVNVDDLIDTDVYSLLDDEEKATIQVLIESKKMNGDDTLLNFEYDKEFSNFIFSSWSQEQKEYISIPFSNEELHLIKSIFEIALKNISNYSLQFENVSVYVECYENRLSVTEYWPYQIKLKIENYT
jgi:hypothetical protein